MLTSVFAKAVGDRWRAVAIGTGVIALWMPMAMAIYKDIDLSIYTDLPQAVREMMGIPVGADAAALSFNVMLGFAGALTIAGLAVSIGAASIAGEERNGTMSLLLGNPRSRTHVLLAKAASMLLLVGLATIGLWVVALSTPRVLDVAIGDLRVGAMMLHLGINASFYGLVALAIGAWTGSRSVASGTAAGLMALGYIGAALVPLADRITWLAQLSPWHYFAAGEPLINGPQWGDLAMLLAGCGVALAASIVGVNRRDLGSGTVTAPLLDRLRGNPVSRRFFDQLAGKTRVSHLWTKATSENQAMVIVVSLVMFLVMGVLMGPMYSAIKSNLAELNDQFPEALLAVAGGGDMSTPQGWFQVETFSLMAPIAIMTVTVASGARSLAGAESDRTMGLLLANPIRRFRIVFAYAIAMTVQAVVVGTAILAGVAVANLISSLGISYGAIAATSLLVTLLGLFFGAVALALGGATGSARVAISGTLGLALTSHLLNSFLPLSERLASWARLTPNHYFLGSDPLTNGMHWGHGAALAGGSAVLVLLAAALFDRRDLRG